MNNSINAHIHVLKKRHAIALGLSKYFTGKPCSNGHFSERYVADGKCAECRHDYQRKNAESINAKRRVRGTKRTAGYMQNYLLKNAESIAESRRTRYQRDKKKVAEQTRAYYESNKSRCATRGSKTRAKRLLSIPRWYGELDAFVVAEAYDLAEQREFATGIKWHVDHMIPLQAKLVCGLHCAGNIQVIPKRLNLLKMNKMMFVNTGEWTAHLADKGVTSSWGDYAQ